MRAPLSLFVVLVACQADLELPEGEYRIACTANEQCPPSYLCQTTLSLCVVAAELDATQPILISAVPVSPDAVRVTFSEPLAEGSADLSHFSISPDLPVLGVKTEEDGLSLLLLTATQYEGEPYVVNADAIFDPSGNPLSEEGNRAFVGYGERDTSAPALVSPLGALFVRPTEVTLLWLPRAAARSYRVEVSTSAAFDPLLVDETVSETRFAITAVAEPVTYHWRVRANVTGADAVLQVGTFDVLQDTVYVHCPQSDDCSGSALDVGNRTRPYRRIQAGLDAAKVLGLKEVVVAGRGGAAVYTEQLQLVDGVRLLGGYTAPAYMRATGDRTPLRSDTLSVITGADLDEVEIEGFAVTDSNLRPPFALAMSLTHVLRATIRDCSFGPRNASVEAIGVRFTDVDEGLIEDSSLSSGSVAAYDGGSSVALDLIDSTVTLRRNRLFSDDVSSSGPPHGIFLSSALRTKSSGLTADANDFFGNSAMASNCSSPAPEHANILCLTRAVTQSGNATYTNNVFWNDVGFDGQVAVFVESGQASFVNNTFYASTSEAATAPASSGSAIRSEGAVVDTVVNNLFIASEGFIPTDAAYAPLRLPSAPAMCTSNVFVGYGSVCQHHDGAACTATSCGSELTAGAAHLPSRFQAAPFLLTGMTPDDIKTLGTDMTAAGVTFDRLGQPRPGEDGAFSVGAYEP